jgi:aspartate/glutamate racemase
MLDIGPQESKEPWVRRVVAQVCAQADMTRPIDKSNNFTKVTIELNNYPAAKWPYYVGFQTGMPAISPVEGFRPTVLLHVRGENMLGKPAQFGMLGGVGPLADASALGILMRKKLNTQEPISPNEAGRRLANVSFDLFSCPPPRKQVLGGKQWSKEVITYMVKVRAFAKQCPGPLVVLSNTAHLNLSALNLISNGRFVNQVEKILNDIAIQPIEKRLLAIGTQEAADKTLYPDVAKRVAKKNKAEMPCHLPDPASQIQLQVLIDRIKSGEKMEPGEKGADIPNGVIVIIKEQMQDIHKETGEPPTHVILSCTEFPLALHGHVEQLEQELNVQIVDTEERMMDNVHHFKLPQVAQLQAPMQRDEVKGFPSVDVPHPQAAAAAAPPLSRNYTPGHHSAAAPSLRELAAAKPAATAGSQPLTLRSETAASPKNSDKAEQKPADGPKKSTLR